MSVILKDNNAKDFCFIRRTVVKIKKEIALWTLLFALRNAARDLITKKQVKTI